MRIGVSTGGARCLRTPGLLSKKLVVPEAKYDTRVPAGPAIEDLATARSLRRYRLVAWSWLVLGVVLFSGFLAGVSVEDKRAVRLLRVGVRTHGMVLSYHYGKYDKAITVQYAVGQKRRVSRINLNDNSPRYRLGEGVIVVYDPNNPSAVRTTTESNDPRGLTWLMILAFVGWICLWVVGIATCWRARRIRRILAAHPWRAYSNVEFIPELQKRANAGIRLRRSDSPTDPTFLLRFANSLVRNPRRFKDVPTVWVVGDLSGPVVLAIPETRRLIAAAAPTGKIGARWLDRRGLVETPAQPGWLSRQMPALVIVLTVACALGALALVLLTPSTVGSTAAMSDTLDDALHAAKALPTSDVAPSLGTWAVTGKTVSSIGFGDSAKDDRLTRTWTIYERCATDCAAWIERTTSQGLQRAPLKIRHNRWTAVFERSTEGCGTTRPGSQRQVFVFATSPDHGPLQAIEINRAIFPDCIRDGSSHKDMHASSTTKWTATLQGTECLNRPACRESTLPPLP